MGKLMKTGHSKAKKHLSAIKRGDTVMIIAGGNNEVRQLKGKTGKVLRFVGTDRVIVEGLNMITRHEKAKGPQQPGGKIQREASVHISNVMYYVEKLQKPVRLKHQILGDGTKVRGYLDPKGKKFVQLDS